MQEPSAAGFWLSPQQKFIWTFEQQAFSTSTRVLCLISLSGPVDSNRVRSALDALVARHEILRTTFRRQVGLKVPFQVVTEEAQIEWVPLDLSDLGFEEGTIAQDKVWDKERTRALTLETGPSVRAVLVKLGIQEFSLILSVPRLCADAPSLEILVRELGTTYGGGQGLPEPFRYVQFAQWQADLLESNDEDATEARKYWTKQQAAALPVPTLPGEANPEVHSFQYGVHRTCLGNDLVTSILGRSDIAAFLLAAWECSLSRLSGQNAFTVGYFADNRGYEELENAVGCFGRILPLSVRIENDFQFSDMLRQATKALEEAVAVQEYCPPNAIGLDGSQVGFHYRDGGQNHKFDGVNFRLERREVNNGPLKLDLVVSRRDSGLELEFRYDASRVEPKWVERLAIYFPTLLAGAIANPQERISRLPLLPDSERRQLLLDWNQTTATYPANYCLHQLFEDQVARTPFRLAVRCGEQALTYQELNQRANQLACYLRQQGVGPDRAVGLCLERSLGMMVAMLAILKAGGAYVALNPDNPPARLAQQLEGAAALITESKLVGQLPEFSGVVLVLDWDQQRWANQPQCNLPPNTNPENLVYVIYTSGSTGAPKGVTVRHRNLVKYADFICKRLQVEKFPEGLQFATVSTLGADLGNTAIFPSLISGGCLHVVRYEMATDPRQFAQYLAKYPVDVLKIVPSHFQALLDAGNAEQLLPRKHLIFGGETLTPKLVERIESLGVSCEILNHYGPTETTVGSLTLKLNQEYEWKREKRTSIPLGRPIQNTQLYVLDQHLEPVPIGVTGELYIAGAGVSAGYLGQPDKTAERFLNNPFSPDGEGRMYRTGDMARYLEGGLVEFLGRGDDQVKVRGFRIELGEIEAAMARLPGVKQAVVLTREDGSGDKRLVAYVVAAPDQAVTSEQLRAALKQQLPDYMVPQAVVLLPRLPLTSNGKIDRKALPEPSTVENAREIIAPRTEAEAIVLKVWHQILKKQNISVTDNFFEIGGHSLMAVQMMAEIRKATGKEVPLSALFQRATIEYIANLLEGMGTAADAIDPSILRTIQPHGSRTPFFAAVLPGVNALGYLALSRHLGPDQPFYMLQAPGPGPRPGQRPYSAQEYEKIASDYVRAMRTVQPEGPYYLGGMCEGARIAFEMARLLESQGERIALLAIMDTWVLENTLDRKRWLVDYYWLRLKEFFRGSLSVKLRMARTALGNRLRSGKQSLGTEPPKNAWAEVYWPGEDFVPPRVESRVTIIKSSKQPFYYKPDPLMGWGSRTASGVDTHILPTARHRLLLREPYVRELAEALCDRMQRIRNEEQCLLHKDKQVESVEVPVRI